MRAADVSRRHIRWVRLDVRPHIVLSRTAHQRGRTLGSDSLTSSPQEQPDGSAPSGPGGALWPGSRPAAGTPLVELDGRRADGGDRRDDRVFRPDKPPGGRGGANGGDDARGRGGNRGGAASAVCFRPGRYLGRVWRHEADRGPVLRNGIQRPRRGQHGPDVRGRRLLMALSVGYTADILRLTSPVPGAVARAAARPRGAPAGSGGRGLGSRRASGQRHRRGGHRRTGGPGHYRPGRVLAAGGPGPGAGRRRRRTGAARPASQQVPRRLRTLPALPGAGPGASAEPGPRGGGKRRAGRGPVDRRPRRSDRRRRAHRSWL